MTQRSLIQHHSIRYRATSFAQRSATIMVGPEYDLKLLFFFNRELTHNHETNETNDTSNTRVGWLAQPYPSPVRARKQQPLLDDLPGRNLPQGYHSLLQINRNTRTQTSMIIKISRKTLKAVVPIALEKHERRYGKLENRNIPGFIADLSRSPVFRLHEANHKKSNV